MSLMPSESPWARAASFRLSCRHGLRPCFFSPTRYTPSKSDFDYRLFVKAWQPVAKATDNLIVDGRSKTGQVIGRDLILFLFPDNNHFASYIRRADTGDIGYNLVHGNASDNRATFTIDEHCGLVGKNAEITVLVADGDSSRAQRTLSDKCPSVTDAFAARDIFYKD